MKLNALSMKGPISRGKGKKRVVCGEVNKHGGGKKEDALSPTQIIVEISSKASQ